MAPPAFLIALKDAAEASLEMAKYCQPVVPVYMQLHLQYGTTVIGATPEILAVMAEEETAAEETAGKRHKRPRR